MYRPDPIQRLPRPAAPRKWSGCSQVGLAVLVFVGVGVAVAVVAPGILGRSSVVPAVDVGHGGELADVRVSAIRSDAPDACGLTGSGGSRAPLDPLDLLLLDSCGPWGGDIDVREAALIVWHFTGDRGSVGLGLPADAVARAWTPRALTHVFCGDPTTESLGGMHWTPRWLAVREHWTLDGSCEPQVRPDLCRVGVRYDDPVTGEPRTSGCPKSHAPGVSAAEILLAGLSTLEEDRTCACPTRSGPVLVVVKDDHEVKTVYPRRERVDLARCSRCPR